MKKWTTRAAIILAAIALPLLGAPGTGKADTVRLGLSAALTGPAAFVGVSIRRGAEMAIDSLNAAGGIDGKQIELIVRDDEHNPVKTVANHRELVEREEVVAMLGTTNSAAMLATAPIINDELKVPIVCPATDATKITENEAWERGDDNYVFRLGMYGRARRTFLSTPWSKNSVRKGRSPDLDGRLGRDRPRRTEPASWRTGHAGGCRRDLRYGRHDMTPQILKLRNAGTEVIINYGLARGERFCHPHQAETRGQHTLRFGLGDCRSSLLECRWRKR